MKESTQEILERSGAIIDTSNFELNCQVEIPDVAKLTKDLKTKIIEIEEISKAEIKTLVNLFYQMQDIRKALTEQIRSIETVPEAESKNKDTNVAVLNYCVKNIASTEKGIQTVLKLVCESDPVGRWLLATTGIGPVLAAGLLAYFDVEGKQYATQFISYAGLNDNNRPWLGSEKAKKIVNNIVGDSKVITDEMVAKISAATQWNYDYLRSSAYNSEKDKWSKDELIKACSKIPYNASAKTLMWKVGKSFQWQCNNPDSLYGTLFSEKRAKEYKRNADGELATQAADILASKNIGKNTAAYKAYIKGELPDAHITARAMRWTEKIFLSHLFEEMYREKYHDVPPRYYALEHFGDEHNKEITPEVEYTWKAPYED